MGRNGRSAQFPPAPVRLLRCEYLRIVLEKVARVRKFLEFWLTPSVATHLSRICSVAERAQVVAGGEGRLVYFVSR